MTSIAAPPRVGTLLRSWRQRRGLSQLDLALKAGVSARHLSFVETGRSRPSPEMVLHLAEQLDVPLRDSNVLLLAGGYAPAYGERGLEEPEMGPVREALDQLLRGHEPYPAVVVDRHWGLVSANRSLGFLMEGIAPHLLEPPVNVLRAGLHPEGLAPRIVNLDEWRAHVLERLARQAVTSGDPALAALHEELAAYPGGESAAPHDPAQGEIALSLRLEVGDAELAFISTVTTSVRRPTSACPSSPSSRSSRPTRRRQRWCRRSSTRCSAYLGGNRHGSLPSASSSALLQPTTEVHTMAVHPTTARLGQAIPGGQGLLRWALRTDALATGANGVAYLALAGPLADLLGLPASFLRAVGVFLAVYAVAVWIVATRDTINPSVVLVFVAGNLLWVVASIGLLVLDLHEPTTAGSVWIALQAAFTGLFAALQLMGRRRAAT